MTTRAYIDRRDVISPGATAVLLSLVRVYVDDGRATVREVADLVDLSISNTHRYLCELRREGLVDWEDGRSGTLRPTLAVVIPRRSRRRAS